MIDSTHYVEIHLIDQKTQQRTVVQLGGLLEHGQAEWVLDQTGVDYSRFRFVGDNSQVRLEYLEGDSTVLVDGVAVSKSAPIHDGSSLRIDDEAFRCELRQQRYDSTAPSLDAGWMSITGSVRPHNEDAVGVYQQPPYALFAVSDGVGGAEAGEIISEFAITYLLHVFDKYLGPQTDWASVFRTAVKAINDEARRYARDLSAQVGRPVQAGCTLTAVAISGWDAQIAHVGDSRLYLLHEGQLQQVTVDHSTFSSDRTGPVRASAVDAGRTKRNVLIKGIGKSDMIEPDLKRLRLAPGDRLLLCSDGMSDRIDAPEIAALLRDMPPQKLAAHLAKTADERRSGDNVSVMVVHVNAAGVQVQQAQPVPQQRAFIGPQPQPHLPQITNTAPQTYSADTDTGEQRLPLHILVPLVIVVLLVVGGLLLARGGG